MRTGGGWRSGGQHNRAPLSASNAAPAGRLRSINHTRPNPSRCRVIRSRTAERHRQFGRHGRFLRHDNPGRGSRTATGTIRTAAVTKVRTWSGRRGIVPTERLWALRHARKRVGMVRRLVRFELLRGFTAGRSHGAVRGLAPRGSRRELGLPRLALPVGVPVLVLARGPVLRPGLPCGPSSGGLSKRGE